jgi:amino acid adenylation domain-containing protein
MNAMKGSYQLKSFTENKDAEVKRLQAQVNLFFDKEFELYVRYGLKNGMKIIECGSGPGFLMRNILKMLPDCDATALEIDPFLFEILKSNAVENNVKLFDTINASIYDTQLPENTFDFIITRLVIEHLQSPLDAIKELYRILKPGGKLVIVSNDFAYHLVTYPVIKELDEMYDAYCRSRLSEGGNPLIGRQIPAYLKKNNFTNVQLEVICVHSDLVGDNAILQAESVNISKSLVNDGYLKKETLDALADSWYRMLKDPDHVIYRQLFVVCGEKKLFAKEELAENGKELVKKTDLNISEQIRGLTRDEQKNRILSFLITQMKRIMSDPDFYITGDEKLCDKDIDSIAAAELSSIIMTNFHKSVSISNILLRYSFNDIINEIFEVPDEDKGITTSPQSNEARRKSPEYKLTEISDIQKQFWILYKLFPKNTAYNIPSVLKIEGEINLPALESAVNYLIKRHEILKASFLEEQNKVYQKVIDETDLSCKIEVKKLQKPYDEISSRELILSEVHKTFDLSTWPLFRIKLFFFNNNISILTCVFHHIIIDLHSLQIFEKELTKLYNLYSSGKTVPELQPAPKYSDYSLWLNNWLSFDKANEKKEEWKQEISETKEILEIAPDFPRPIVNSLEGKSKYFQMDTNTSMKIKTLAREHAVNDFAVLLSAYAIFLNRISNKAKIIIGVPLTNRRKLEFTETFGCFVNIVPVMVDFTERLTGSKILLQVRQSLLRAHGKQELPFLVINDLLRDDSRNSVFQAGFTFQPPMRLSFNNLDIQPVIIEKDGSQLDLFLTLWEAEEKFNAYLEYSTLLYRENTIERFINIFRRLIDSFLHAPHLPVSELDIVPEEDTRFMNEWNETEHVYEKDLCIHQKFEQQVKKSPESIALITPDHSITYSRLNEEANRLAHHLIRSGVKTEDKVAICLDRSVEMMVSIFAVLKAGAAYIPLNPGDPAERLSQIIHDADPILIITSSASFLQLSEIKTCIEIDSILKKPISENTSNPDVKMNSRNLAYIIYTSGSTGIPKGVMIEHHSVLNRLGWMQKAYPITGDDTLLQKTPITFDVSVWELFWWSFNGARLALLPAGGEKDPITITEYIKKFNVSVVHFVPSMFSAFLGAIRIRKMISGLKYLRYLFLSGEVLTPKLVRDFNTLRGQCSLPKMINLYGPTEATVDVSYYNCPEADPENVYIGRPIDNTKLYVVSGNDKIQPVGIPGELIITGLNLARGYINNPELSEEKFNMFQFFDKKKVRGYRSGDLVRLTDSGELEFIRRKDMQVKIRGYRIEPGEIESNIMDHPLVENCAVLVYENEDKKSLVAYVCIKKKTTWIRMFYKVSSNPGCRIT